MRPLAALPVGTLNLYFGLRALKWMLGLFALASLLILLFDGLELVRRTSDADGFSLSTIALVTLLRLPSLSEQLLPFAVLFGSIGALMGLTRKLELVVARSAGVSVWQFLAPIAVVSLVLGVAGTTLYNPLATWTKTKSDALSAELFGGAQTVLNQTSQDSWFRQSGPEGDTIMHARGVLDQGHRLFGVTVFTFDETMSFKVRIEATGAVYTDRAWQLNGARVFTTDAPPREEARMVLPTNLTAEQVTQAIANPDSISFWDLPGIIDIARQTGQPANRFALQFQSLLAKPALLFAMVLIAATVSLRYSRSGQMRELIVGGVLAGFLLYVVSEVTEDFGAAGLVPPVIAAWSAPTIAMLMGLTILLHTEDG